MTDVFNETQQTEEDQTKDYLEALVGEGKKFKTVQDLAKGKAEADRHIESLTKTLDELRAELTKEEYSKKLLEQLGERQHKANTHTPPANENGEETEADTKNEVDLESLVEKALLKKEQQRTASQNLTVANNKMVDLFGDKAPTVLKSRASELGMSVERLKEIASESPTAFLSLMGGTQETKTDTFKTKVNTETFNTNQTERGFKFYQELRRKNRREYFSPKVQKQMEADIARLGKDRFLSI